MSAMALCLHTSCGSSPGSAPDAASSTVTLAMSMTRITQVGLDPFQVTVEVQRAGQPVTGANLVRTIPKGSAGSITDNGDGTYDFTVTPTATGIYPVTITYGGATLTREALVLNTYASGVGQPMLVPGLVNTDGYEDGITITPDGQYLFIQYGPLYFSGVIGVTSICAEAGWSLLDLTTCPGKNDSEWVFETIGPYNTSSRPSFPVGAIANGNLTHMNLVVPGVANHLPVFPTVFYGFKRQADGTFKEPFKLAFNDARGTNGPFGLSFQMTSATTAKFAVAWDNAFNNLGDDGADVYSGTITMGQNNNLGDVTYTGDVYASITPNITPVSFTSNAGAQGNPHIYYDGSGVIKSIWVDDESSSHDLTVYRITAGTYPSGTWVPQTLAPKINTVAAESQPFFTGTRLYLNRDTRIVYHEYIGSGGADYDLDASWGNEVEVLGSGDIAIGSIFGVGEPTIATVGGKKYLYFAYILNRSQSTTTVNIDFDLGAAFVEIP